MAEDAAITFPKQSCRNFMTAIEKDYILGTNDEEINRLGLQHRVWRPRVLDAWTRAGFTVGHTILDVGCGPGFASVDLAEIVGPGGTVIALDRSRRFLDYLEKAGKLHGLGNIVTHEIDLDRDGFPPGQADAAWCRWVLAFMKNPRNLLEQIGRALKPGGVAVFYEYFDYSAWRLAPGSPEMEEFVQVIMKSWRADGGEPEIGISMPSWLGELGFIVQSLRPIIDIIPPSNYIWEWGKAFVESGSRRMVELGRLSPERAAAIKTAFTECERRPHTLMITPGVIEIIAIKI